jgi:hypothetical protein
MGLIRQRGIVAGAQTIITSGTRLTHAGLRIVEVLVTLERRS